MESDSEESRLPKSGRGPALTQSAVCRPRRWSRWGLGGCSQCSSSRWPAGRRRGSLASGCARGRSSQTPELAVGRLPEIVTKVHNPISRLSPISRLCYNGPMGDLGGHAPICQSGRRVSWVQAVCLGAGAMEVLATRSTVSAGCTAAMPNAKAAVRSNAAAVRSSGGH